MLTFAILTITTKAYAGPQDNLFGELALGYDTTSIAATNVSGPNENGTSTGFAVEARGGYVVGPLLAGVSVFGTAGYLNYTNPSIKSGYWNKTFTYAFLGFNLGPVRIWGDYGIVNQMRLALDYGTYITDKIYTGGVCWKAGVGIALSPRIHLNAEYYENKPDSMSKNTGPVNWNGTYTRWQETGYMFSIAYNFFGSEIKQK